MRLKHIFLVFVVVTITLIALSFFKKTHLIDNFKAFSFPPIKKIIPHKNKIDGLVSNEDIVSFIVENSEIKKFSFLDTLDCEYNYSPWTKADFNNDGYNDLVIFGNTEYGNYVFAIMDSMGCKYKTRFIQRIFTNCVISKVYTINQYYAIFVRYLIPAEKGFQSFWNTSIYVYEFDDFIEYNPTPTNYAIHKVEFSTTPCYGDCAVFDMTIKENGELCCLNNKYKYMNNGCSIWPDLKNFTQEKYSSTISPEEYVSLSSLLNYVDFTTLQSDSSNAFGDLPLYTLKVTYDKNLIKTLVFAPGFDLSRGFRKIEHIFFEKYYQFKGRSKYSYA